MADTVKPGAEHPAPVVLEGNGNVDRVRFFGGGSQLVSVSGTKVAWWSLGQPDRLARSLQVPIRYGCTACAGPRLALSRDGRRAAIVDGVGTGAALVDLTTGRSEPLSEGSLDYQQPVFGRSGSAAFPVAPSAGGSEARPPGDLPAHATSWVAGEGRDRAVAAGAAEDGDEAVIVSGKGKIFIQRLADGSITRTTSSHPDIEFGDVMLDDAAIAPSGDRVATLLDDRVSLVDLGEGKVVTRFPVRGATRLAFGGDRLFVQNDDGSLEVRIGARLERTLIGDPSYVWPPVPNPQGTLVARQRANGQITLVDVDTGSTLVTLPPNPGAGAMKIGVGFSPDGRRLVTVTEGASAGSGATMIVRDLTLSALTRSACRTAGHELSPAEWRRFVGTDAPE